MKKDKIIIIKGSGMSLCSAYLAHTAKKLGFKVIYDGVIINEIYRNKT